MSNAFKSVLGKNGELTANGMFTLATSNCLGVCGLAPVVIINDEVKAKLNPETIPQLIDRYSREI